MLTYDFVGQTIGSYRILERIGLGGMGQVYRGVHVHLDRTAAIKVLHGHLASDPDFEARFRREARSAASLDHPNIVAIHDFGEQAGILYLIMELVTDGSVRTLLHDQPSDSWVDQAAGIDLVRQAAEGLAYAHRHGMIHRDIKPENLLLKRIDNESGDGFTYVVKVADFGLARMAEGSTMTLSGTLMGTPAYMSPEQCQGLSLDSRSDQYSLGVVLYEVVTGRRPFESSTATEAVYKHVHVDPTTPTDFRPDLDPELIDVILRALAKRPDDRFPTTGDFVRALRSIQARLIQGDLDPYISPPMGITTLPYGVPTPTVPHVDPATSRNVDSSTMATPVSSILDRSQARTERSLSFSLDRPAVTVTPGERTSLRASVANLGATPALLTLAVDGFPADWVQLSTPSIALAPGEQSAVELWIDVPTVANDGAGQYEISVGLCSEGQTDAIATTTARLDVLPPPPPLAVIPLRQDSKGADFQVRLRHDGSSPDNYLFRFQSGSETLDYRFQPEFVAVAAGETATTSLMLQAPQRRLGMPRSHAFTVSADALNGGGRHDIGGVFRQPSQIPIWAPATVAVALIAVALLLSTVLGGSGGSAAAAAPEIEAVSVDPQNPVAGQPVTVYWDVLDADRIDIEPLVTGLDPSVGSYTFSDGLDGGSDLTLVAVNDNGSSEERVPLAIIAETATPTATTTISATETGAPTGTVVVTATRTPISRPLATKTPTTAPTATNTTTPTPTSTIEPTPTNAPVPPTNTPVPPPTPTNTPVPPPPPTNTPVPPPPPEPTDTPVPPTPTPYPTPPPVVPTEPGDEYPTPPPVV